MKDVLVCITAVQLHVHCIYMLANFHCRQKHCSEMLRTTSPSVQQVIIYDLLTHMLWLNITVSCMGWYLVIISLIAFDTVPLSCVFPHVSSILSSSPSNISSSFVPLSLPPSLPPSLPLLPFPPLSLHTPSLPPPLHQVYGNRQQCLCGHPSQVPHQVPQHH